MKFSKILIASSGVPEGRDPAPYNEIEISEITYVEFGGGS